MGGDEVVIEWLRVGLLIAVYIWWRTWISVAGACYTLYNTPVLGKLLSVGVTGYLYRTLQELAIYW